MSARPLAPDAVGPPAFAVPAPSAAEPPHILDLSSHRRARDALAFGLHVPEMGFNIFVVGEDRSGRMTATLELLAEYTKALPPPADWLYLQNFRHPDRPQPYRLPAGNGRLFRERIASLIPAFRQSLARAFEAAEFAARLDHESQAMQQAVGAAFAELETFAAARGLKIERTQQGLALNPLPGNEPEALGQLPEAERQRRLEGFSAVRQNLGLFVQAARQSEVKFADVVREARRGAADAVLAPLMDPIAAEFGSYTGLRRWIIELRADLIDRLDMLAPSADVDTERARLEALDERYGVNLFVDHGDNGEAPVVLEPHPSYDKIFGRFEYRMMGGLAITDHRYIRAGALHRANGGILVLRAESVAAEPMVWTFLKGALRDRCIRIEPPQSPGPPLVGAPVPHAIPLDLKVVIIGAPRWYYAFFSVDPDFATYFKIKADIDPDLPADAANLAVYASLVRRMASRHIEGGADDAAVVRLLAETARWAGDRRKLAASFERVEDLVIEAAALAREERKRGIELPQVLRTLALRAERGARVEDRAQESIRDRVLLIDTEGSRVGQVNGLTVRDLGDHSFGMPVRISARVHAGRRGIANIERATEMGGPIQQKGVYIIGGYLSGCFARRLPISFSASVTFEQSYGGVEGDSASMGELVAVLSALAEVPLRQEIAITGSVNQAGESQPIGGASDKIEGFFRVCANRGLTGRQGVLIPAANASHVILREEVASAIAAGRFHLWTMTDVYDALELLTAHDPGRPGADGSYPAGTVMARVESTLVRFDELLRKREMGEEE